MLVRHQLIKCLMARCVGCTTTTSADRPFISWWEASAVKVPVGERCGGCSTTTSADRPFVSWWEATADQVPVGERCGGVQPHLLVRHQLINVPAVERC